MWWFSSGQEERLGGLETRRGGKGLWEEGRVEARTRTRHNVCSMEERCLWMKGVGGRTREYLGYQREGAEGMRCPPGEYDGEVVAILASLLQLTDQGEQLFSLL